METEGGQSSLIKGYKDVLYYKSFIYLRFFFLYFREPRAVRGQQVYLESQEKQWVALDTMPDNLKVIFVIMLWNLLLSYETSFW